MVREYGRRVPQRDVMYVLTDARGSDRLQKAAGILRRHLPGADGDFRGEHMGAAARYLARRGPTADSFRELEAQRTPTQSTIVRLTKPAGVGRFDHVLNAASWLQVAETHPFAARSF